MLTYENTRIVLMKTIIIIITLNFFIFIILKLIVLSKKVKLPLRN